MPFADVNGQHLAYEDTGGDGPAVILSHGFLMNRAMFAPQVAALKDRYRVITWDERGFGETPARGPFTYWDSADDCIALLDHLGVERAVLGGMSQGGFLSLRAALRYPDRVRALVLIDTAAEVDPPEVLAGYQQMLDGWAAGAREQIAPTVAGLILGPEEHWEPWVSGWADLDLEGLRHAGAALLGRDDISPRVPEITCPAIVFHGSEDTAIPLERAQRLCRDLPKCEGVVEVPGAFHAPNLTHPDAVNPRLIAFLDGLG
ncbi:MAG: alpha/beta fold hydrolase [Sandaracinaceae bacterium]